MANKTYYESDLNEAWRHRWLKAIELSKAGTITNNNVRNTWRYALGFAIEVMDLGCMSQELMDTAITPTGWTLGPTGWTERSREARAKRPRLLSMANGGTLGFEPRPSGYKPDALPTGLSAPALPVGRLHIIPVEAEHPWMCVRTLDGGLVHAMSEMLALNITTVTSTVISSSVSCPIGSIPSGELTSRSSSSTSTPSPQPSCSQCAWLGIR